MAISRFAHDAYATIELNKVSFVKTGRVLAQLPLSDDFTAEAPCENGMWLKYDIRNGVIDAPAATDKGLGLVYSSEKLYDTFKPGLKNFFQVAGDYARLGMLEVNDTYTTNCFCFDSADFADGAAVVTALKAIKTTPLYLIPSTSGVPQLVTADAGEVKRVADAQLVAEVVKYYTMPDGQAGIKIQIIKAN